MKRVLGFVFGLIFALVLAEGGLRLVLPIVEPAQFRVTEDDPLYQPDDHLGHTMKQSEALGIDARGFRNQEAVAATDIVVLGDSHTFGSLDYEPWTVSLGEQLGQRVYNMGVSGYGIAHYAGLLPAALDLDPTVVVIALYLGNDIHNAYDTVYHQSGWEDWKEQEFQEAVGGSQDDSQARTGVLKTLKDFLRNKTVLYPFVADRTRHAREHLDLAAPLYTGTTDWTNTDPRASLLYNDTPHQETRFRNSHRLAGIDIADQHVQEGLRLTQVFLEAMHRDVQEHNAQLLVALLPTKQSVYQPLVGQERSENELFSQIIYSQNSLTEQLVAHSEEQGYMLIDTLPTLQHALLQGGQLYPTSIDDHPNAQGYHVYAEVLSSAIATMTSSTPSV